ncbi:hypothetical protein [Chryseobacterium glaciei]|nr:hypothetical protein [Chryseobacterium glaciei]
MSSCNKDNKVKDNVNTNELTIQSFIPKILEGRQHKIIPSMSNVFEDSTYLIKQFDETTFVVTNKNEKVQYGIKYSGGTTFI